MIAPAIGRRCFFSRAILRGCGLILILCGATGQYLSAQTRAPLSQLGVDMVALKSGPRLRGAILNRDPTGNLAVAIRRDWLATAEPAFYGETVQREAQRRDEVLQALEDRIAVWMQDRPDDAQLQFFLKKESQRISAARKKDNPDEDAAQSEFLKIALPAALIARVRVQPAARKQIALLAWRERLPDVETTAVTELEQTLRDRGLNPENEPVDLTDRLPAEPQSDQEWAARQAIFEYQYRQPLDYQGTGTVLVRTDGAGPAKVDLLASLTATLQQQLKGDLATLLGESPAQPQSGKAEFTTATTTADREGIRGIRITRVDQTLASRKVSVQVLFLARMPDGSFETVWKHTETLTASKPRPELERRIADDPNIQQALKLINQLGLPSEGEQIKLAIRFGAATMQAQQTADGHFFAFRDRYLQRLDLPPLTWAAVE